MWRWMGGLLPQWRPLKDPCLAEPERVSGASPEPTETPTCQWSVDEEQFSPDFPIDAVYTWVDFAAATLQAEVAHHKPEGLGEAITDPARWVCHEELRYSLRSLEAYAPWLNKIYIVTNGQRPTWLADHPKIRLVCHSDILERENLPTFNSHVLESALHRIAGLSEHYIYFNDDIMLLRPVEPTHFFTANGLGLAFLGSVSLPPGSPRPEETATNWAAKNARNLMLGRGFKVSNLRLAHTCHPQVKSVAEESERIFSDTYQAFRKNRFRAIDDLLVSGYLNQCLGYQMSRMLYARIPYWYLLIRRQETRQLYRLILSEKGTARARMSVCANDHPVGPNANAEHDLLSFLRSYFPERSGFESD